MNTKYDSILANRHNTPIAFSKISEKSNSLIQAINSQRCATARSNQNCTFANTMAVVSKDGGTILSPHRGQNYGATDPQTLELIERLNEKLDEIFN